MAQQGVLPGAVDLPPGPEPAVALARIDPESVPAEELVDVLRACSRQHVHARAGMLRTLAAVARRSREATAAAAAQSLRHLPPRQFVRTPAGMVPTAPGAPPAAVLALRAAGDVELSDVPRGDRRSRADRFGRVRLGGDRPAARDLLLTSDDPADQPTPAPTSRPRP